MKSVFPKRGKLFETGFTHFIPQAIEAKVDGVVGVIQVVHDDSDQVVHSLLMDSGSDPVVSLHHDEHGYRTNQQYEGARHQQQHQRHLSTDVTRLFRNIYRRDEW